MSLFQHLRTGLPALCLCAQLLQAQEPAEPPLQIGSILQTNYALTSPSGESNVSALNLVTQSDRLRLNEATFSVNGDWNRIGFRLDGGYGDFYHIAIGGDNLKGANQYLEQAYVFGTVAAGPIPVHWSAGKFFSSVGAETPPSYQNFNQSRSLLFNYGGPLHHTGVRASAQIGTSLTVGVQVLEGWNTTGGAHGHQTMALSAAWSRKHWGWSQIYLGGNTKSEGRGWRQLSDTVLTFNPTSKNTGYAEMLFAAEKRMALGYDSWYGWAGAWKFSPSARWSFSPRAEWFNDVSGATTGLAQRLTELTLTAEHRPRAWMMLRLEYRSDWASRPFYGQGPLAPLANRRQALTAGVTLLYHSPKNN
jgi:hypothetical protein